MPNWVECKLQVVGPKKELKKFMKKAETSNSSLSLEQFIPTPKILLEYTNPIRIISEEEYKKQGKRTQKI